MTLQQVIFQLEKLQEGQHFTATRVGAPGCAVRMDAEDNRFALDAALNILRGCAQPLQHNARDGSSPKTTGRNNEV